LFENRAFFFNWNTGVAILSFVPSHEDNLADDWETCDPPGNNGEIFRQAEKARQDYKRQAEQQMEAKFELWEAQAAGRAANSAAEELARK